jgi:hypothetical protein
MVVLLRGYIVECFLRAKGIIESAAIKVQLNTAI